MDLKQKRLKALEECLRSIAEEQKSIHHSELKSLCERGYRYSYATGKILARRVGLTVK